MIPATMHEPMMMSTDPQNSSFCFDIVSPSLIRFYQDRVELTGRPSRERDDQPGYFEWSQITSAMNSTAVTVATSALIAPLLIS
jgi:hypothetical protein